jgi:transposase
VLRAYQLRRTASSARRFIEFAVDWPLIASGSSIRSAVYSRGAGHCRFEGHLHRQIDALDEAVAAIDKELAASVKAGETAKRSMIIPNVGPVTASAIMVTIGTLPPSPRGGSLLLSSA